MADTLTVYKALKDGVSPFQHYPWPLPSGGQPGDWVGIADDQKPALCVMGVHGYLTRKGAEAVSQGNQVFEMVIEGDIVKDQEKATGRRGRLIRQLSGVWKVTLGQVLSAAALTPAAHRPLLQGAARHLGIRAEEISSALRSNDIWVAADGDLVRVEQYLQGDVSAAVASASLAGLVNMPLVLKVG